MDSMTDLINRLRSWKIWADQKGQDMIEYALASGIIAVGIVAAMPIYCNAINMVFSKVEETVLNSIH